MTRTRALLWPTLATLAALAVLISLGTWQLQRLAWKEALIRSASERSSAEPLAITDEASWKALDPAANEYRRVSLTGVFRHELETAVFTDLAQSRGPLRGRGWLILTPLQLADGSAVWINRGFVPDDRKEAATRPEGQVAGTVAVTGLLRGTEGRNAFTPADDAAKNVWYTRDPAAMSAAKGLARAAPFFVDADGIAPGGMPQGGETRLSFPNRHLEYALTWFGLAGALGGVYIVFAYRRLRAEG